MGETSRADLIAALQDMVESMETIARISMVGGRAAAKLDEARTIARHAERRARAAITKAESSNV